jgi:ketosteroid isomerase-like protein
MKIKMYLLAMTAFAAFGGTAFANESLSDLLKRQTQEFSDAGKAGDAAAMDRLLDPDVVFTNENNEASTKKDLVSSAKPPAGGVKSSIQVTNWHLQQFGDVAVGRFVDVLTQDFHGQTLHAEFFSTETWKKEQDGWKMIASQTTQVPHDPPGVTLSTKLLDEYAGTYSAGPDFSFVFTRKGGDLFAACGGGKPTLQKVELADVLFTPGTPRTRKIFQRDAKGKITSFLYRRDGSDIVFKRVG